MHTIYMYVDTAKHVRMNVYQKIVHWDKTAPEASWSQVFDPWTPLLIDLYHYLVQNWSVGLVPEHAPAGPSSQVLPVGLAARSLLVTGLDTIWDPHRGFEWYVYRKFVHSDKRPYNLVSMYMHTLSSCRNCLNVHVYSSSCRNCPNVYVYSIFLSQLSQRACILYLLVAIVSMCIYVSCK